MQTEEKSRMALNFDLNLHLLKKHYPSKRYTKAYKDIERFLNDYDFIHRQQSGYVSRLPMSMVNLLSVVKRLSKEFYWLTLCAQVFDVTVVVEEFSLLKHIAQSSSLNEVSDSL